MKTKLISILVLLCFNFIFSQVNENELNCYIVNNSGTGNQIQSSTPFSGTTNVAFFLCVEKGQNDSIFTANLITPLKENMHDYFEKATLSNYHVNITDVLVKKTNIQSGYSHLFVLPDTLIPYPSLDTNFVVAPWMVKNIFAQADSLYDFNNFDSDNNGIVDYVVFMVIRYAKGWTTGTAGLSINSFYTTNDTLANGNHIKIDGTGYFYTSGKRAIIQRKRTTNFEKIISISVHEMGHSLFAFPDMDHSGNTTYDHYALGRFSPMSMEGFRGRASLYNPYFRIDKGWVTPTEITSTNTISFTDFDDTGLIYEYNLPSYTEALPNQKILITEFNKPSSNRWQEYWPIPNIGDNSKGIMVMEKTDNGIYSNSHRMPIQIVSAHGKWLWDRSQAALDSVNIPYTHAINLGIEDPLKGLDSLQVRYSYMGFTWDPSIHWWNTTPVYTDGRIGSASCFYNPFQPKELSFYSNPNSNEKLNNSSEQYSSSVLSNFKMKNIRIENNIIKADVIVGVNANTITTNTTLAKGSWYINNDITVSDGITLTIQEGTEFIFNNNSKLIVNGTLTVNGTTGNPVVFDFNSPSSNNGIKVNGNAVVNITNAVVKNAVNGLYVTNANYSVSNTTFDNCTYGVVDNNLSVYNGSIYNCQFTGNSYGVLSYYGNASIKESTFENNTNAVYCWNANAYLGEVGSYGNNYFSNNQNNIYAYGNSYAFLGRNTCTLQGGNNYFVNSSGTDYHLYAGLNSTIIAENNYWGYYYPQPSKFYHDGSSTIDYTPYLSSPPPVTPASNVGTPEEILYNTSIKNSTSEITAVGGNDYYNKNWPLDWKLFYARNLIMVKKNKKAAKILKDIITDNVDSSQAYFALNLLRQASGNNKKDLKNFAKSKLSGDTPFKLAAKVYLSDLDSINTLSELDEVLFSNKASAELKEYALANKILHYANKIKDYDKAGQFFDQLITQNHNSEAISFLNDVLGNNQLKKSRNNNSKSEDLTDADYNFELKGNYPNPFNPSTVIKYSISKDSPVTLRVFDLLGREVALLVKRTQSAGEYSVEFDASKLSSGVYIYRLESGMNIMTRKMMLLR